MRAALIATFVGVVAALATVGAALTISVHRPLGTLETIANEHAKAVEITASLGSSISEARRAVVAELSAARAEPQRLEASRMYGGMQDVVTQLSKLCDTPFEAAQLDALRDALTQSAAESNAIETRIANGDLDGARERVAAFLEITREANDHADAIVSFNAVQVEHLARRVYGSIRTLALATLVVSIAAAAGAYALLKLALRGLASHQALWRARFTDVDAFAARAAHELRTPLQTLKLALSSEGPAGLERARRSADRMSRTVDALLELSRAGAAPTSDASADVRAAVADVQEELAPSIEQQRATVEVDVPPALAVGMSLEHLRTIVRNLVANALRYGVRPSGGRVEVRARALDGRVCLAVEDGGPGIPAAVLPHVLEPFTRGTDAPGGYGIGLATVNRLVQGHGGSVAIDSVEGRGTTVHVMLPRGGVHRRGAAGSERKPPG
jgi:signal transduction histidine kinase